jgi:glycosyltransferase involved in cell wall biosynthesis
MDQHCRDCAEEMSSGGFDILLANSCMTFRVTSIARFSELPSVLYLQEPYRRLYEALPEPPWAADRRSEGWWHDPAAITRAMKRSVGVRRRQVRIREEANNARNFDVIACNSLYSRESILRAYGVESEVCYLGVDVDRLTPATVDRLPFFLTVGAAAVEKNIAFIVRALALRSDRSWPLVWVANLVDERHLAYVRDLAAGLGIALEVKREISHDELLHLYRQATLFLYAPRLEPFGLVPLEAAACGLPTLAVAEAGTRETIVEGVNGFLVAASEAAFAARIDDLVGQPDLLREMAKTARADVEAQWSSSAAAERLERLLCRTAGSPRPV